jgi:hypothetical protein
LVAALGFQMLQEVQHPWSGDIGQTQVLHFFATLLGQELKEAPQGVTICPDRVRADSSTLL